MTWRQLAGVIQDALVHDRTVVTRYTLVTTLVPVFLSYYVMALLVQLPHTRLYRISLLPMVFWMTLRANMTMDFSFNHPGYAIKNHLLAVGMFTIAMRSATWVLAPRCYTRIPVSRPENGTWNNHTPTEPGISVFSVMWNAWDLILNLRCVGWDGPEKIPVPTSYFRVESQSTFLFLSLSHFVFWTIVLDALLGYIRSLGPETFGTSNGGTIFDPLLAPPERYLKSSLITFLTLCFAYTILEAAYQLYATLHTILFWQLPSQPPLFDSPWLATSLNSFWGRRWHQLFREYFVAVGKLSGKYFGQIGAVMGVFAVSGILHEIGVRGMGRGSDTLPVVGFFLVQGVGLIIERAWKRRTGKRVGGIVGWLWTWFWLLFWGQFFVDASAKSGLFGSEIFPETYRPMLLLLNWRVFE